MDWRKPKVGRNFSRWQLFTTCDEVFLSGYMEKPSNTTKMAIFPFRILKIGQKIDKYQHQQPCHYLTTMEAHPGVWAGLAL
jgi:hypothetical protein